MPSDVQQPALPVPNSGAAAPPRPPLFHFSQLSPATRPRIDRRQRHGTRKWRRASASQISTASTVYGLHVTWSYGYGECCMEIGDGRRGGIIICSISSISHLLLMDFMVWPVLLPHGPAYANANTTNAIIYIKKM